MPFHAPRTVDVIGQFTEKSVGNYFEFSPNDDGIFETFPHKVWVTSPKEGIDSGYRYAHVKKTVCYIAVDEDDEGEAVVEQWFIKARMIYN